MQGLFAVYRKELSDHFSSYRFVMLFALIAMVSFITSYMAGVSLRENLEGTARQTYYFLGLFNQAGALFSMVQFVAFFGPLIGLVLGFDAINRERSDGTLIKIVTQPIYRDSVINGKFLAGVTTIAVMVISIVLVISGLGLTLLGIVPGLDEILRLAVYVVISVFYISFWLGVAILFSIFFRGIATSALASVALWIFLSFFVSMGAGVLANTIAPLDQTQGVRRETLIKHYRIKERIGLLSPMAIYSQASATIIDPTLNTTSIQSLLRMGPIEKILAERFQRPLSLGQSLLVVFPHLVALVALSLICFAISYLVFMKQEIRT
ncbi:MAG: ABC transporter permease [Deltaproteobacteria bacterium]|nr:ABC transporter permease [Deltaproteobacteria bacterium]MBW2017025.1 ABC transporter permease [Deltaproteobacteria bacterium]MBW2129459.1 ABC transporter permease [Deltaproteobacteria bacterium]MBW2302172.1 ABC transporter permease [Deltaproteobacteria bacterium]